MIVKSSVFVCGRLLLLTQNGNGESVGTVQRNTGGTISAAGGANAIGGVNSQTRNTVGIYFDDEAIFGGQIGDVAFFDYLLTQDQVRRIARQMMTT